MKPGISTASFFAKETTEDALCQIEAMDAPCAEVFMQTFSEYNRGFGELMRRQCAVPVNSVHALTQHFEMSLFSSSERQRQEAWALFESALEAGQALGASYYVMHGSTSAVNPEFVPSVEAMLRVLRPAMDMARQYGIQLTLENVSWCMCRHPDTVYALREALPGLCYTLDIKQAHRMGVPAQEYIDAMGKQLRNVHICDWDEKGSVLLPGDGVVDLPALINALRRADYDGAVLIEVYPSSFQSYGQLKNSLQFLRKICGGNIA